MPRYFFNVHDGSDLLDEKGSVLPAIRDARAHALLDELDDRFWAEGDWRMDVSESGLILFSLMFLAVEAAAAPLSGHVNG